MKEKAIKIVSDSKKRVLDYIEAMRKTPPVKLYYYRTSSGTVSCKIKTNSCSLRYSRGMGRAIRINRGDDSAEYPLIISAHYLLDFLYKNNIDYKNILIDPQSIEVFYMFNNYTSANLTPSLYKEIYSVLEAKKMSLDELENKLKEIQEYEKWIQSVL